MRRFMAKKLSLVLGGGGARGYVHLGVLKVLEENGIVPDFIIGTSMGSLVGACYATGMTASDLIERAKLIRRRDLANVDMLGIFRKSMFLGKKIDSFLYKLFGETEAEKTKIPCACVASSLDTGKTYILEKGPLWKNVRASISVPICFPEVEIDGIMMCDGGCTNNLPDDVARNRDPENIILSVDCMCPYVPYETKFEMLRKIIDINNILQYAVSINKPHYDDIRVNAASGINNFMFEKVSVNKAVRIGQREMKKNLPALAKLLGIRLPKKEKNSTKKSESNTTKTEKTNTKKEN